MPDIAKIFMKASAKKDDMVGGIVDRAHRDNVRKNFDNLVTSVQFLMEARINRGSGTNLAQFKTKDIQGNIKNSLTNKIEEVKDLAAQEFPIFFEYFSETTLELTRNIDEQAWQTIVAVQGYNLANDFDSRFLFYLKDLSTIQLDAVLKLLILTHIKQRLERSVGLDG